MDENPPPPPPLPTPQLSVSSASCTSPCPLPGQAAIPFAPHESEYPVQETNPTSEALQGAQDPAQLTEEDEQAIQFLVGMGLPREEALQLYMLCNKNAESAANILLEL